MEIVQLIESLVKIPSPSGYTKEVITYLTELITSIGYEVQPSPKGGILVSVSGKNDQQHRYLTAHVDALGAMVRAIKPDGRLMIDKIGGFGWNMIEGENCIIHSKNKNFTGTILLHQTSGHVYKDADSKVRDMNSIEIRLDEKVWSKTDTEALGIEVGDYISFDPRFVYSDSGFVKSRHLDDKASVAILISILKSLKENETVLPYTTHFYFSTFEEVGFGGNSLIPKEVVEYLAVDMGAIGDYQASDEYHVSICVKDSSGPYHYDLRNQLVDLCEKNEIPFKKDIYLFYGSDASAAMRAGAEVRHGLIGPGIESSHAYERTHIDSLMATYRLIECYLKSDLLK